MPTVATMSGNALWPWIAAALVGLLVAGAWVLRSLRRREDEALVEDQDFITELDDQPVEPQPLHSPAPPALAVAAPVPPPPDLAPEPEPLPAPAPPRREPVAVAPGRARLTVELRPLRAGVNLLSATAEAEVTVTNSGDATADDVRAELRLVSAHAGQDQDIAAIYLTPIARPATPPFPLVPGETRQLRLTAALPREAIRVLTAADRPMFVPLIVANVTAASRGLSVQTGQAYAIGIERPGSSKLAPFWLDGASRMYNSVSAIPQGPPLER